MQQGIDICWIYLYIYSETEGSYGLHNEFSANNFRVTWSRNCSHLPPEATILSGNKVSQAAAQVLSSIFCNTWFCTLLSAAPYVYNSFIHFFQLHINRFTYKHPGIYTCSVTHGDQTVYVTHYKICVKREFIDIDLLVTQLADHPELNGWFHFWFDQSW